MAILGQILDPNEAKVPTNITSNHRHKLGTLFLKRQRTRMRMSMMFRMLTTSTSTHREAFRQ